MSTFKIIQKISQPSHLIYIACYHISIIVNSSTFILLDTASELLTSKNAKRLLLLTGKYLEYECFEIIYLNL